MAMKQSTSETSTSIVDPQDNHETPFEFDRLPKEIAEEIMSRMPVESLKQLKLVNKSTYSLIKTLMTNPKFVAKHLHHRTSEEANNASASFVYSSLFVEHRGEDYVQLAPLLALLGNTQGDASRIIEEHRLPSFCNGEGDINTCGLMVSHCDGIVVFVSDDISVSLCNLALRELTTFSPNSDFLCFMCTIEGIGIGYDSRSETYKVVRIVSVCDSGNWNLKAEVYTVGTVSWREIEIAAQNPKQSCLDRNTLNFRGSCYWLMVEPDEVLSFEMSSEAFRSVTLPDYRDREAILEPCLRLAMWNGSVCLLCYDKKAGQQSSNYIRKWVMEIEREEDSGYAYSWRECPSIRLVPGIVKAPLTFWKDDELLVTSTVDEPMRCYNVGTGELRTVPAFCGDYRRLCSNPYVASLVSFEKEREEFKRKIKGAFGTW